ncbi:MAG: DUF932 domain-containing protein [Leptospirales bacterium]|nr:DUF932 domain-containing protein [Leptospirales bacterium]
MEFTNTLTEIDLRSLAPSIFADHAFEGVSSKYKMISSAHVIETMGQEGWHPVMAGEQRVLDANRRGFQKHLIRLRQESYFGSEREVAPEIVLTNTHDATGAFILRAGLFRFVCGNGLIVTTTRYAEVRIRHFGFDDDQVKIACEHFARSVPAIAEQVDQMRELGLTETQRIRFGRKAIACRWDTDAPITPDIVLRPRRAADCGNDLWQTFNVAQENLLRGCVVDGQPKIRRIQSIDSTIALNTQLWHLASRTLARSR